VYQAATYDRSTSAWNWRLVLRWSRKDFFWENRNSEKLNGYMLDVYIMHYTNMHLTFLTNTICPLYVSICEAM